MNCALEYILRGRRVEKLLSFPCSLFLESKKPKKQRQQKKAVNVLQLTSAGNISVKHYELFNAKKDEPRPPFSEVIIPLDKVFTSATSVVPGYRLFEFLPQPYASLEKQVSEMPLCVIQERQYTECLEFFYTPKKFNIAREDWLWGSFASVYLPPTSGWGTIAEQRASAIKEPNTNKLWTHWLDTLLFQTDPASELIFASAYKSKFLYRKFKEEEVIVNRLYGGDWIGEPAIDDDAGWNP